MAHTAKMVVAEAQAAVHILVKQYHQDLALIAQLNDIKSQRMAEVAKISKQQDSPLRTVLANQDQYPEFAALTAKEALLKAKQQSLWDSMLYKNPVVWLMYKYQAYQGGNNVISTLRDLKKHCEPKDYICTKRFRFLNAYLASQQKAALTDTTLYSDGMKLPLIYESTAITSLVEDEAFMKLWSEYEFYRSNGKVAKWENYQAK